MLLIDKGPVRPVPELRGVAQDVSLAVQSWPGVISATHWLFSDTTQVDGADFYVGEAELGHIHLDGEVHLALTRPLRDLLVERRLARPFRWGAEWVVAPIRSRDEGDHAEWLFRLGYDRLDGVPDAELVERIETRAA